MLTCELCKATTDVLAHTKNTKICLDCVDKTHKGFTTQITKLEIA